MMCEERTAVSLFGGWPSFSLCGGLNEPYAGDVAAVRAGLRRRILLRLRKSAKNIETGAELASGSDSSPCLNNADPRSLSSITPPPQQPIPLPHPWLEIQPQRAENRSECTSCPVPKKNTIYKNKSAQRSTSNTEEYRNQIGTVFRIQYRSIQKTASKQSITNKAAGRIPKKINRHSTPHPTPKHTETRSAQCPTINTEAYRNQIGTASHIQYPSIQTQVNTLPSSTTKNSLKKARGVCRGAAALRPLCGFLFEQKNSSYIAKM